MGQRGQQELIDANILDTLQANDYWNADYTRVSDNAPVNLYMAYYESQRIGVSAHSPANCIPGGGWLVDQSGIIPVMLDTTSIPVSRMIIRKGNAAMLVYYWFDQRGRIFNKQYGAKWYLLIDSITKHRTDGAIIRLVTPLAEGESEQDGDARLSDFTRVFYPAMRPYIPQ